MELTKLIETTEENRDRSWENQFFQKFTESSVNLVSADPQQGPDGWPYLLVQTEGEAKDPVQKILHWCATKGIGLAVNPMKEYPDYVFTYGMIWHFRQTGYFFKEQMDIKTGVVELSQAADIVSGSPSEEFLPQYVRSILREFFRDQAVLAPKMLVLSQDGGKQFDLCFSLESLGQPPEKEHQGILEAISWYFPPHYSLMLISEKNMPPFFAL